MWEKIVPKSELGAAIGKADHRRNIMLIREDIARDPDMMKTIRAHEAFHLNDPLQDGELNREIRANRAGFKASPVGFLKTVKMSLTKERLGFYWRRFFG